MLIMSKIIWCHKAIEVLVENKFASEAISIATTEYELRLDLFFIMKDRRVNRSREWWEYTKKERQPWRVSEKISKVWDGDSETRSKEREIHRWLCAVKHGNPVARSLSFPMTGTQRHLAIGVRDPCFEGLLGAVVVNSSTLFMLDSYETTHSILALLRAAPIAPPANMAKIRIAASSLRCEAALMLQNGNRICSNKSGTDEMQIRLQ
jgi:hypothetical protein